MRISNLGVPLSQKCIMDTVRFGYTYSRIKCSLSDRDESLRTCTLLIFSTFT